MTKLHVLLAQADPAATAVSPGIAGFFGGPMFLFLMLGAMYFLVFAPQMKKQKEHKKMIGELKAGDEVMTAGGIYGLITGVKDDRFVVRIGDNNAKVEVGKEFITAVVKKAEAA